MITTSIGELKLHPVKVDGKFVFHNDDITINGKKARGDMVRIFVDKYEKRGNTHHIRSTSPTRATIIVRGKEQEYIDTANHTTVEELYNYLSDIYKTRFYFGE